MQPSTLKPVILVVDDNTILRHLITRVLRRHAYDLLVATNAQEAIQQAVTQDGPIHLLLSDVEMPGMSGITLARTITRQRPATRILLTSGNISSVGTLEHAWEFLPKPFTPERLLEKVNAILRARSLTR